ncbi:LacI family transcriptional regulator [Rhizocola hellebori]|uniref:LacI family transcriptional regulator n=1 Tax=Rhizocola hellebori TaxID=1392758 RepID=A0A8J3QD72_9ACTN|nr:LacI family DNA-binding transcriptional regulator [Rhizocola hellebori]GIH08506.1 LacI family transcriptional regulator [Rhizocola hellebori]
MAVGNDGSRRGGVRQVAAAAGVSMSTVSNVLNRPDVVAAETRQRVEDAMSAVGFVRNGAARQLRGAPSSVVGCIVLDSSNIFFAEVVRGMEDKLAQANCLLVTCSTDVQPQRELHYLRMLDEQGVRGVIVSPVIGKLDGLVSLSRHGVPVVLLDRRRGKTELCAVTVDNVRGGRLAVQHLLELGHQRIAMVTVSTEVESLADRAKGARLAIRDAGLAPDDVLLTIRMPGPAAPDRYADAVDHLLALTPRPTAALCFNDTAAVGVLRELRRRGIAVPTEMSVMGYDDVHFASELSPALTTVRQPRYQLGWAAAELLLAESDARHRHQELLFQPDLVVRASTCPPRRPGRRPASS